MDTSLLLVGILDGSTNLISLQEKSAATVSSMQGFASLNCDMKSQCQLENKRNHLPSLKNPLEN